MVSTSFPFFFPSKKSDDAAEEGATQTSIFTPDDDDDANANNAGTYNNATGVNNANRNGAGRRLDAKAVNDNDSGSAAVSVVTGGNASRAGYADDNAVIKNKRANSCVAWEGTGYKSAANNDAASPALKVMENRFNFMTNNFKEIFFKNQRLAVK